jgi:hypothetical protein
LKTKFISVILSVAVMLSLMLVPAVPTALAATSDWGYNITPNVSKVGFNTDFNVTVSAVCYAGNADTWNIMVDFDQTYLQVIGITRPATLPNPPDNSAPDGYPGEPTLNNTDGWVFDGYGTPPGKATVGVSFAAWTIHFRSKNVTTSGTPLSFVTVSPYYSSMAILAGADWLNWTEVVNGTVKIGSPALTVDVSPAGKGTVKANGVTLTGYPNTTSWVWDQVVNLSAVNSTSGWGFASWTGTNNNTINLTTVTMDVAKNVTANFAELPPELAVSPLSLAFSAMCGNNTDSDTVKISNTGGGTLNWTTGSPPTWLSFNKTSGSLGINASEDLLVTANTSGLNVTTYNGNFTISAPPGQEKTVDISLEVTSETTIVVMRDLPPDALDMDAEHPGDSFYVYVNFTAPRDNFNAIGLTDLAPAGWDVETDVSWCDPVASWTKGEGNKAEYAWSGESSGYNKNTTFSAKYLVTIPATASPGYNYWPNCNISEAWVEYWFGPVGPNKSCITGDWQKIVTVPGKVWGETRDVNADLLTTTLVVCSENPAELGDEPEDSDSSTAPDAIYSEDVDDTGQYYLTASKYCWFDLNTSAMPGTRNPWHDDYINFTTVELLAAGYPMDFEGDYGLVPKACTMSYAMKSVNHCLFPPIDGGGNPHPEWQLSVWKAMESVHSWQFPMGCNT